MGRLKSILGTILIASLIFTIWKIWGQTGQLDVFFGMVMDAIISVLQAFSVVWEKAWEAVR